MLYCLVSVSKYSSHQGVLPAFEEIEKKFVLKSVSEGYSRKLIRMNLNYIIRSAGRARNLVALVTAGELLAMLDDMNEFESTGESFNEAKTNLRKLS